MNLYELDNFIKYYSNQKDDASKKIVEYYKKQRPILKDKIKIELKKKGIKCI